MSIAITGLTCVACPTLVPEWDDHGETGNFVYKIERLSQHSYGDLECFSTDSSECPPCNAAYDIFSWALWIWQLMTNHHSTSPPQHSWYSSWSPLLPIDPASWPDFTSNIQFRDYEDERRRQGAWQVLEEERLGHILVKAWNQEYESADQVMHDVKEVIVKMGMKLIGEDEIELEVCGGRWEDVFDQDLQFACLEKETS